MKLKKISKKALVSWYIGRVLSLFFFAVLQFGFLAFFSRTPYFSEIRGFLYAFLFFSAVYLVLTTIILPLHNAGIQHCTSRKATQVSRL